MEVGQRHHELPGVIFRRSNGEYDCTPYIWSPEVELQYVREALIESGLTARPLWQLPECTESAAVAEEVWRANSVRRARGNWINAWGESPKWRFRMLRSAPTAPTAPIPASIAPSTASRIALAA